MQPEQAVEPYQELLSLVGLAQLQPRGPAGSFSAKQPNLHVTCTRTDLLQIPCRRFFKKKLGYLPEDDDLLTCVRPDFEVGQRQNRHSQLTCKAVHLGQLLG